MQKRNLPKSEPEIPSIPEELEFKVGRLVSFYSGGTRYGHITEIDVDDDGDLWVTVQPIGSKLSTTKTRALAFKSKELQLA